MSALGVLCTAGIVVVLSIRFRPRRQRIDDVLAPASPQRRPDALMHTWRHRRLAKRQPTARAVAGWCDELARSVRSGSTLRDALGAISTDEPAIDRALAPLKLSLDRGSSVHEATQRADDPGQHLQLALAVVATASRIGGPSSAAIDRTAMALRRRAADDDDRSTQAAQARISTHVMTALPLLMLAVLAATDADVRGVAASPLGAGCIAAGLVLNLTGWWWMRRIVRAGP